MREIKTTVYTFDELNDRAKETAREWYRQYCIADDWYTFVYEDAERVGLKITAFDLRGGVEAEFLASAEETAHKIEEEHGKTCATYTTAKAYLKKRDELIDGWPKDGDGEFQSLSDLDARLDELDDEFSYDLREDYRIILQNEIDWIMSEEAVDENILANEYEFTADGKRA